MSFKNVNLQSKIKRSIRNIEPIVLEVKTDYYTACPNPIEIVVSVISGKIREHSYRWSIISGSSGRFTPNSRSLNVTFDPLGKKDRRQVLLIVDEGKIEEQRFTLELYDNAVSYSNATYHGSASTFPRYNEKWRSCNTIDMNISDATPSLSATPQISRLKESGVIIYPNSSIDKVELYRYPEYTLLSESFYPDDKIVGLKEYDNIIAKTYYIEGLKTLMFWDFVNVININTGNIVRVVVQDNLEVSCSFSESKVFKTIGSGIRLITNNDSVEVNVSTSESIKNTNKLNTKNNKDTANNSPRLRISNSSSTIFKKINYRTGVVG